MKRLLIIPILFLAFKLDAAVADKFGTNGDAVSRSSFTDSNSSNHVLIASAPNVMQNELGGNIILRSLIISGVNPSTVTFYDSVTFAVNVPTVTKIVYNPNPLTAGLPVTIPINVAISSGLMCDIVEAQVAGSNFKQIKWDYTTPPRNGGVGR